MSQPSLARRWSYEQYYLHRRRRRDRPGYSFVCRYRLALADARNGGVAVRINVKRLRHPDGQADHACTQLDHLSPLALNAAREGSS